MQLVKATCERTQANPIPLLVEVIRVLAGHIDVRTTQIYVDVSDQRKAEGIAALERSSHPLAT